MAHFFVPPGAPLSSYGTTTDGGYLHAWRLAVPLGGSGKIGLWGGYDRGYPLTISSNNPGIIDFQEPPMSIASGDRFITVTGRKVGFTILDAGNGPRPWCSLQVEVQVKPFTVKIPAWQIYRIMGEYYKKVLADRMRKDELCRKWSITREQLDGLV